ncbi:hypothetical protein LTR66_002577 [Elasticomyces elasticus]|nr:hypothetical protein LTR66_002577 [Elasticomyces elasticus]
MQREWDFAYHERERRGTCRKKEQHIHGRVRGLNVELFCCEESLRPALEDKGYEVQMYSAKNPWSIYPGKRMRERGIRERLADVLYWGLREEGFTDIPYALIAASEISNWVQVVRIEKDGDNTAGSQYVAAASITANGVAYPVLGYIEKGEPYFTHGNEDLLHPYIQEYGNKISFRYLDPKKETKGDARLAALVQTRDEEAAARKKREKRKRWEENRRRREGKAVGTPDGTLLEELADDVGRLGVGDEKVMKEPGASADDQPHSSNAQRKIGEQ